MDNTIQTYHNSLSIEYQAIATTLYDEICRHLPEAESKVWHGHPVWFIEGNPVTGYSERKAGMNLMFWSGQSFEEAALKNEGKFKAAEIVYTDVNQLNKADLKRWLNKARDIQWDYKNLVRRKGLLERLK
ncbi:DUF1801 domain-containing protein [Filimonas effusa]|uniref:DUF1801 domain-containing protein n=1 Tax=Filimonas effusa TaxID=2508721 RepID=A0A4V1M9J0_9BACT|nr:DUF1801 domain-containing protein [Filimonas effusa]RXK81318.1 DUF1801 domain-containing protein [Filimonas effusa]